MKFLLKITFSLLFIFGLTANAQEMKVGFTHLEKGEFAEAEVFFSEILKEYPKNKTAQLCYARAIGLNNKADKALETFIVLKNEYPGRFLLIENFGKINYFSAMHYTKILIKSNT